VVSTNSYRYALWSVQTHTGVLCGQYGVIPVYFVVSTNSYRYALWSVQTHAGMFHIKNSYRCALWSVQTQAGMFHSENSYRCALRSVQTGTGVLYLWSSLCICFYFWHLFEQAAECEIQHTVGQSQAQLTWEVVAERRLVYNLGMGR